MAYTFKDSDADKTFFKDYNKVDVHESTLVGNWHEERALKQMTGQMRSTQWVAPSSEAHQGDAEPMRTKMKGHPDLQDTTMRVFFHSDYVEPKDFKPASQMFREDPWRTYEDKGVGARTALMQRRARELAAAQLAAEEAAAAAAQTQLEVDARGLSEARASFVGAMPARGDDPSRGKRIMKTQDGAPARRDPLFLVEHGVLAPHLAVDVVINEEALPGEAVMLGDTMHLTGQTKAPGSTAYPRGRNDFFSKPIELTKKPGIWDDTDDDHVYPAINPSFPAAHARTTNLGRSLEQPALLGAARESGSHEAL
ncbi:hypothetical protein KFE25_006217 [Diacronema lutheri]|uniref:Uncharacterized protein n=1 Tax=Diacronema lutheri TaxID=2081491 RepID=A0A8J6CCD0_DIALT|nr:hypothetical protein KFE25_006217 [Diacronema lutheri]